MSRGMHIFLEVMFEIREVLMVGEVILINNLRELMVVKVKKVRGVRKGWERS